MVRKKLTRVVFALNKKEDLRTRVKAFEEEKNSELESKLEERGWKATDGPNGDEDPCCTPLGEYVDRYIAIRSSGAVGKATIRNENNFARYIKASIGHVPLCDLTTRDVEVCLLAVPDLSRKWAEEKRAAREENRKQADWCKKHHKRMKPLAPIRVAGPDLQSKILKFLREVLNYAVEKEDIAKMWQKRSSSPGSSRRASHS